MRSYSGINRFHTLNWFDRKGDINQLASFKVLDQNNLFVALLYFYYTP